MTMMAFEAQRAAQGREAQARYDRAVFDEMSPAERLQAEQWLMSDARKGISKAYMGLACLGTPRALAALESLWRRTSLGESRHMPLSVALFNATQGGRYRQAILNGMADGQDEVVRDAVVMLDITRDARAVFEHVLEMPAAEEAVRAVAASKLMQSYGFPELLEDMSPERLDCERRLADLVPGTLRSVTADIVQLARCRGYVIAP